MTSPALVREHLRAAAATLRAEAAELSMNSLMRDGRIKADAPLWRRPNRVWVTGLARQMHQPAETADG